MNKLQPPKTFLSQRIWIKTIIMLGISHACHKYIITTCIFDIYNNGNFSEKICTIMVQQKPTVKDNSMSTKIKSVKNQNACNYNIPACIAKDLEKQNNEYININVCQ